jgi:hypothetical protein
MILTLLHLPCSHVITACRMRRVLHKGSNYMSLYYSVSTELKTWEPRFEPLLDPSQWPVYDGMDYALDMALQKIRKGRRKKKRFRNEMDDMEKDYDNDKVHCSACHGEGHTMNRHQERPKRNPRARGAVDRNRRSGATDIIVVTHMSNIEKLFYLLVCSNIIYCICN